MRLADAGRAQEDDVLAALDETEFVQTLDLIEAQGRLGREVEVAELLHGGLTTGAHGGLQPLVVPKLDRAMRSCSIASGAVSAPPSMSRRIASSASRVPGTRRPARSCGGGPGARAARSSCGTAGEARVEFPDFSGDAVSPLDEWFRTVPD